MEAPRTPRILVIDDDGAVQISLALLLKQSGFDALRCDGPDEALALLGRDPAERGPIDLVLQDMNFSLQTGGAEGLALLAAIRERHPALPVLLMTAWGSISLAVAGIKAGAANFFTKPWDNTQLVELIAATLDLAAPGAAGPGRKALDDSFDFGAIVGEHPKLLRVLATIGQVARTRAPVLILGESGTGKELVADAIHRNSPRAGQPIIKINMGAITPTLFESEMFGHVRGAFTDARSDRKGHVACADGGTLFLDEIGELNRGDQVKLLRVLQDQRYQPVGASRSEQADIRVVSATNRELAELVAAGEFREDLFYRLNLITIRLPPLRERRSDIPLLARHIAAKVADSYGLGEAALTPGALDWLGAQAWPGNIRQLKQTLERTLLLAGKPQLSHHDFAAAGQLDDAAGSPRLGLEGMTLEQVERRMIEQALDQHSGNITRVAKALGLSRTALYRRLERHGLAEPGHEPGAGAME
ncbi:sigma-54-dependent transcriptional regulator [Massilia yuzhufengensis]|uniref:DNA-binding transcriptional response regulator, NtrC family, contains REC, AAA-type ATPase, and a Fis-type DNA-binding domains n=1 Tax=Massilia yuzhufengensis TaxID=1164594 RepID=A0A1I1GVT7_9BURK|nr:sigma-54 dependent transcriptional regulator [Massilia yuzhufengensis]SFC13968.1 DNA-binding transcriptional response regulator, NtrC family, contains REC, AAA-type ATPase, and a Fis-type DNA-binding domains [Massilia yuzhufengensis]